MLMPLPITIMSTTDIIECQNANCTDTAEITLEDETGEQWDLCEDHAHMTRDGQPIGDYEPDDPSKFSDEADLWDAFVAGFNVSTEGWNGEIHPYFEDTDTDDHRLRRRFEEWRDGAN